MQAGVCSLPGYWNRHGHCAEGIRRVRARLVRWALRGVDLMLLSQGEQRRFKKAGGSLGQTPWLPFGMDAVFWRPADAAPKRRVT